MDVLKEQNIALRLEIDRLNARILECNTENPRKNVILPEGCIWYRRIGYKQAQRVGKNMLKSFDMMWLFLENPEIEPTNNFAERQIKHFVKYRPIGNIGEKNWVNLILVNLEI